jgi:hypothetical protein
VGPPDTAGALLSLPVVLYDYPAIAPQSQSNFFDSTDIDEVLTLRVLTLTDAEKAEMQACGTRTKALLEYTEKQGLAALQSLHGTMRRDRPLVPGAVVRLRPGGGADILDSVLRGQHATVESVETDFEGRSYVAVTINADPGRDLGAFGHRFFFRPEELECL